MHCIIAWAACARLPDHATESLHLPRLQALLGRLQPTGQDRDPPDAPTPPSPAHERAHARALGWDTQAPLPWAAWQTRDTTDGSGHAAQAWITPCHWQVGMDQVFMLDPAALHLGEEESRSLLQALQPWLQEDGLQVRWHDALHWHARGELFDGWTASSLDQVIGANVRPWITRGLPAALVRLHSEMQMLAYNHPVNDARLARGQLPVNAFWVHGAGRLQAPSAAQPPVLYLDDLRSTALQGDVQGWRDAWQRLDARLPAADTPGVQLTLCSESTARHWQAGPRPWLQRLQHRLRPLDTAATLKALIKP